MSPEREQRYQDVGELAEALLPYVGCEGDECLKRIQRRLNGGLSEPEESELLEDLLRLQRDLQRRRVASRAQSGSEARSDILDGPTPVDATGTSGTPGTARRGRRILARLMFATAFVPLMALAGLAVTAVIPGTAVWSDRARTEIRQAAKEAGLGARALLGEGREKGREDDAGHDARTPTLR
jgi:hypothetical protein